MGKLKKVDESKTGRNTKFIDTSNKNKVMTRAEVVKKIDSGLYPDYYVRKINNVKTPVSKPDKTKKNNLG